MNKLKEWRAMAREQQAYPIDREIGSGAGKGLFSFLFVPIDELTDQYPLDNDYFVEQHMVHR